MKIQKLAFVTMTQEEGLRLGRAYMALMVDCPPVPDQEILSWLETSQVCAMNQEEKGDDCSTYLISGDTWWANLYVHQAERKGVLSALWGQMPLKDVLGIVSGLREFFRFNPLKEVHATMRARTSFRLFKAVADREVRQGRASFTFEVKDTPEGVGQLQKGMKVLLEEDEYIGVLMRPI